jgi:indoleamine 2,3-dioxygenase
LKDNGGKDIMLQQCWDIWGDRGFLINPDPIVYPVKIHSDLLRLAERVPELLEARTLRGTLDALPLYDLTPALEIDTDFRVAERLMQVYSYLASAYVYAEADSSARHIPANIAVPLVRLAHLVERPPILSYAGYVLNNWRRSDPAKPIALGNIETIQHFMGGEDEDWFILVHVDIEARAARALRGVQQAVAAADEGDTPVVEQALLAIAESFGEMIATFQRMPEHCDSDVYYWKVRPYIFGFNEVVYEGVTEFAGKPMSFRGQTGAQSSIIPVMVAALGLQHERSALTQHLEIMQDYMPKPHRELIQQMQASRLRAFVSAESESAGGTVLRDAYNECLGRMLAFRQLHYHYATTYIAEKVSNPLGTGGTIFMEWLGQLARETEAQMIPTPSHA